MTAVSKKKVAKVPAPGSKDDKAAGFYSRKKWRALLQQSELWLAGRGLNAYGALVIGTALHKNSYVVKLDLSGNKLGDDGATVMADVLRINTSIQMLNLSQNNITDVGAIALASAFVPCASVSGQPGQWNRTLLSLVLLGNELGDDALLALSNAATCHRDLTYVDLSWNHVGAQGTKCLLRSYERNPLCKFVLSANNLGDEGTVHLCEALARFGGETQASLNLYRNSLGHRGAEAVGHLIARSTHVREVALGANTIGLKGAQALRRALERSTASFRSLDLSDNMLGDDGAREVAHIIAANLPALERLDLADNGITDSGAIAIFSALKQNTALVTLSYAANRFGQQAVAAVEACLRETKSLKLLDLSRCLLTSDQRHSISIIVSEVDGIRVEMGSSADGDGDRDNMLLKMEEYLQLQADQAAQQQRDSAKKSAKKRPKKTVS